MCGGLENDTLNAYEKQEKKIETFVTFLCEQIYLKTIL